MNVLLVDDDSDCLETTQMLLEALDHHCVAAADPRDALELFLRQKFDLVITDFRMPCMTGSELARKIINTTPDAKIVLLSGYYPGEDSPVESLFTAFLEKPVDIHELKSVLSSL